MAEVVHFDRELRQRAEEAGDATTVISVRAFGGVGDRTEPIGRC
jgi:hypothetical protein